MRAVCDMMVAPVREEAGRHEYDGVVQPLDASGVAAGLARIGAAEAPRADAVVEAHLAAFEQAARVRFGRLEAHRWDPVLHVTNLDVSCYDRDYGPAEQRAAARERHLAAWPAAVDAAVRTLDAVSAPVAGIVLPMVRGLGEGLTGADGAARSAVERFAGHLEHLARTGNPDPALGAETLAALMSCGEGDVPDLELLARRAAEESARLDEALVEACADLAPGRPAREVVADLHADRPDGVAALGSEVGALVEELTAFCRATDLVPYTDGELRIGEPPASRRFAMAMMAWAAPDEPDGPSWYWITPPDPTWPDEDVEAWNAVFCRTSLPAITAHEVVPGHLAHARALRRVEAPERRLLHSPAFVEGWAHYAEEMLVEVGFRAQDRRFRLGVVLEALIRVTRLEVAIGLHTGEMSPAEATDRFRVRALLDGVAARSEAERALVEPTYGRYAWGKLAIREAADGARRRWGADFSLPRFHRSLLELGSPPITLLGRALAV
ncbi:hypothetical protein Acsp07_15120 [Actinomycetospora sp. NBRC 106378]|nr:hypothetical protein Acsp07_15120 [Actinomycetospora sp. NBRC 106378]